MQISILHLDLLDIAMLAVLFGTLLGIPACLVYMHYQEILEEITRERDEAQVLAGQLKMELLLAQAEHSSLSVHLPENGTEEDRGGNAYHGAQDYELDDYTH